MTVGNAEQLVATVGVEDSAPYNFRTAGGSADIGDRLVDKLVGGTICWNQLTYDGNFTSADNWEKQSGNPTVTIANNEITVTLKDNGTPSVYNPAFKSKNVKYNFIKDHIYLFSFDFKTTKIGAPYYRTDAFSYVYGSNVASTNTWTHYDLLKKATSSLEGFGYWGQNNASTAITIDDSISYRKMCVYDFTAMFGSAIADYIYSLETATAGAGVAWFRHLFPKSYYAYNPGELMSVKAASHKTVGFNALNIDRTLGTLTGLDNATKRTFDFSKYYVGLSYDNYYDPTKITEYHVNNPDGEVGHTTTYNAYGVAFPVRVLPNTTYRMTHTIVKGSPNIGIGFYDADGNKISYETRNNTTFITPNNCHILTVVVYGNTSGGVAVKDICLNLSWDGERDGEYEPYTEHVYPLDSSLTLRGIPKLDANNNLYYDGDTYESDGTVTRRYGVITLDGTKTYSWNSNNNVATITVTNGIVTDGTTQYYAHTFSDNPALKNSSWAGRTSNAPCIGMFYGASYLFIKSTDIESAEDAKTYFTNHPTTVLYVLAAPTTESADPFQNPQIVDDFGTEEYVDAGVTAATPTRDVAIPVGHETTYRANLRAKLEMAPDSPSDGDGDYIVRQTNGTNEYAKLVIPTELPTAPTTDGTYHLKATVSGGTTTLTWEADT